LIKTASSAGGRSETARPDWLPAGLACIRLGGAEREKSLAAYVGGPEGAETILFNHSILTDSEIWKDQAERALRFGYRVICLDFRGHGASSAFAPPYTLHDLVNDNVFALDQLNVGRAHFVGVSLGGMAGLGLGILHPDRIESLCLCAARGDAPEAFAASWDERISLATKQGTGALVQSTSERWLGAGYSSHPHYQLIKRLIEATSINGFVGSAHAIQKLDFLGDVGTITAPTTLIVGQNDTGMLQPMHTLHDIIKGSHLELMPSAGHIPQLDDAEKFNDLLFGHLREAKNPVAV
jgi:3-oxoadipate enol-lactonase